MRRAPAAALCNTAHRGRGSVPPIRWRGLRARRPYPLLLLRWFVLGARHGIVFKVDPRLFFGGV